MASRSEAVALPDPSNDKKSDSRSPALVGRRLDQLPVGCRGTVLGIEGDCSSRQRLLELGLVPGVEVGVTRIAPLGDPIEISFRNSDFSLSRREAAAIILRTSDTEDSSGERPAVSVRAATTMQLAAHPVKENGQSLNGGGRSPRIAIAGNPNTGKTTLFNVLTGLRGHVGNFPGVTVERLVGRATLGDGSRATVVDIPGTYSLNARGRDEQVALSELLGLAGHPPPDAVVVVLNAQTLERSIYLLLQIQELGLPTVAVVNMADEAESDGDVIHYDALADHLRMPVVRAVARRGEGIDELRHVLARLVSGEVQSGTGSWHWSPGEDLARHLDEIVPATEELLGREAPLGRRRALALWCLMSLEAHDDLIGIPPDLRDRTLKVREQMQGHGHDLVLEVTEARYRHVDRDSRLYIERAVREESDRSVTERIDAVLTHPFWGALVFLTTIGVLFAALMDGAFPIMEGVEQFFSWLGGVTQDSLPEGLMTDLLVQGVIGGVGSVLVFLPQILILFLFLTLLEASGYLARAAFLMDRLMRKLGLPGKAFVPMLSGFACAIPAIMSTRTLENRRDRLITMMVIPLFTCSARLPVFTLVIAALFPSEHKVLGPIGLGTVMMIGLYLTSVVMAFAAVGIMGRFVLKGEPQRQILELPPYRVPRLGSVMRVLWQRGMLFLRTAGTVILVASIVLWAMLSFPRPSDPPPAAAAHETVAVDSAPGAHAAEALEQSLAGRIGRFIEPVLVPLGFDWKIGVGLIGAFAAREVFISTMGLVYGLGSDTTTLSEAMREHRRSDGSLAYGPVTGAALLVFFLLSLQCFPTIAVVRQESGSWRWPAFQFAYMSVLAYTATLLTYQVGSLLFG